MESVDIIYSEARYINKKPKLSPFDKPDRKTTHKITKYISHTMYSQQSMKS